MTTHPDLAVETFTVVGMTCDHCVKAVTSELQALPGVSRVEIDLASGAVTVESAEPLSHRAVAAAVEEAGYELAS